MLHDKKYVSLKSLYREGQRTRVEKNDILISITAELGKIGFVEDELGEAYVNQHVALVRITSKQANPKFVAYYLAEANQRNLWQRLNDSGAKAGLNLQTINKYPIYLPSLTEQITIADSLSTWDQAIERTERLIAAKETRYSWLLRRMITKECAQSGWKRLKLKDILGKELIIAKGKALRKDNIIEGGIPVVAGGQTYAYYHGIATHEMATITVSASGAYAGFVWYHDYPIWASDCNVIYAKNASLQFFYYALKFLQDKIYALQSGGAQPHVYEKDLKNLIVPVPPIEIQKEIVSLLNNARLEIDLLKKQADAYRKQKRGLMQKLLTGKWRIKNEYT